MDWFEELAGLTNIGGFGIRLNIQFHFNRFEIDEDFITSWKYFN